MPQLHRRQAHRQGRQAVRVRRVRRVRAGARSAAAGASGHADHAETAEVTAELLLAARILCAAGVGWARVQLDRITNGDRRP